jgi:hypothetical protein
MDRGRAGRRHRSRWRRGRSRWTRSRSVARSPLRERAKPPTISVSRATIRGGDEAIVIGAHYDHLGHGGEGSPRQAWPGPSGADDRAGTSPGAGPPARSPPRGRGRASSSSPCRRGAGPAARPTTSPPALSARPPCSVNADMGAPARTPPHVTSTAAPACGGSATPGLGLRWAADPFDRRITSFYAGRTSLFSSRPAMTATGPATRDKINARRHDGHLPRSWTVARDMTRGVGEGGCTRVVNGPAAAAALFSVVPVSGGDGAQAAADQWRPGGARRTRPG